MMSAREEVSHCCKVSKLILATVIAITAFGGGCNSVRSSANDGNQSASISKDSKAVFIPVDGLICVACAARIKQTLQGIDGVTDVSVDLEHRSVRVQYRETKTSIEGLVAAINGLGYKAGKPSPADPANSPG